MARAERPIWQERPSLLARGGKLIILAAVVILVVVPFLTVVASSLATQKQMAQDGGLVLIPFPPTLKAYQAILLGGVVTRALIISIGVTTIGSLLSLAVTTCMAYALSRPGVLAAKPVLLITIFTFLFTPGIIPSYLVVKELGLLNSYVSLVLPVLVNTFNFVVLRSFFMSIPTDLVESARMDGAGDLTILLRIVLPLSKAVLAVIALFYAVSYWNSFFNALLYLNSDSMWPLQLVLRLYVLQGAPITGQSFAPTEGVPPPALSIQMAVVVIATIPILLAYPFLQRYFAKGVLTGAVKG